jgi:hypothetical protein
MLADPIVGLLERAVGVDSVVLTTVLSQDADAEQMDRAKAAIEEFGVDEVFQKLRCWRSGWLACRWMIADGEARPVPSAKPRVRVDGQLGRVAEPT